MGGSFSANMFSASVNTTRSKMMQNISSNMKSTCGTDNVASSTVSNVAIHMTDVHCDNINVITQKSTVDIDCHSTAMASAAAQSLADYAMGNRTENGGVSAEIGFGNLTFNDSKQTMITTIKQAFNTTCGKNSDASSIVSNASVDMSGVSCENLNVIQQNSSVSAKCILVEASKAFSDMQNKFTGGNSTGGNFNFLSLGSMLSSVVIIGIIAFAVVLTVRALRRKKIAACAAAYDQGLPPDASCPVNLECQHASGTNSAMPATCDPSLNQGSGGAAYSSTPGLSGTAQYSTPYGSSTVSAGSVPSTFAAAPMPVAATH